MPRCWTSRRADTAFGILAPKVGTVLVAFTGDRLAVSLRFVLAAVISLTAPALLDGGAREKID